jgi:shikimate dehydrogenase
MDPSEPMKIDSNTVMYGVIGDPIKHSKSPVMLNRAFCEAGLNSAYAAFEIPAEKLKDAIYGIRALRFGGMNVTIPHKVDVMAFLDEIDEGAQMIGAVNTIVNQNGKLIGFNTDGIGYVRSLKEETGISIAGKNILLLGAGGAARGIGYALAKEKPAAIWVANRTPERAIGLADDLSLGVDAAGMGLDGIANIKENVDLVVNTTSSGMNPNIDELPIDPSWFHGGLMVSDLIYNPLETKLLREAKSRGAVTHGGLGMFIYQGAYAFEYWTGKPAPAEAMRKAVEESFKE